MPSRCADEEGPPIKGIRYDGTLEAGQLTKACDVAAGIYSFRTLPQEGHSSTNRA